jgi:hypothetical protein
VAEKKGKVSYPHYLNADPNPVILVKADPDQHPALKMNADQDPGKTLLTFFTIK